MKIKFFVLVSSFALSLTGCTTAAKYQANCSAANSGYLDTWNCIRSGAANRRAPGYDSPQGMRYLAVGDALAEQVRAGRLTDTQAKAQLAIELERDVTASQQAAAAASAGGPVICNQVGTAVICN